MPEYAHKVAMKELKRLMNMGPFSPENAVIRNYLELMTELPWSVSSTETIDIRKARKVSFLLSQNWIQYRIIINFKMHFMTVIETLVNQNNSPRFLQGRE